MLGQLLGSAISGKNVDCLVGLDNTEGEDYDGSNATIQIVSGSLTSMSAEASVGAILR